MFYFSGLSLYVIAWHYRLDTADLILLSLKRFHVVSFLYTFNFALMASHVTNHVRVICPSGLLRSTNSFLMNLSLLVQRKVTKRKGTPGTRASHTLSHLHCQRVVLTRIHARQDSIDHPWPIDPTSEAVFGELNGEQFLPMKFAEAFAIGRENPTGMLDLVMSSPDGESGRPVGKGEC